MSLRSHFCVCSHLTCFNHQKWYESHCFFAHMRIQVVKDIFMLELLQVPWIFIPQIFFFGGYFPNPNPSSCLEHQPYGVTEHPSLWLLTSIVMQLPTGHMGYWVPDEQIDLSADRPSGTFFVCLNCFESCPLLFFAHAWSHLWDSICNVIANLNKWEKLNGHNYDPWSICSMNKRSHDIDCCANPILVQNVVPLLAIMAYDNGLLLRTLVETLWHSYQIHFGLPETSGFVRFGRKIVPNTTFVPVR